MKPLYEKAVNLVDYFIRSSLAEASSQYLRLTNETSDTETLSLILRE